MLKLMELDLGFAPNLHLLRLVAATVLFERDAQLVAGGLKQADAESYSFLLHRFTEIFGPRSRQIAAEELSRASAFNK